MGSREVCASDALDRMHRGRATRVVYALRGALITGELPRLGELIATALRAGRQVVLDLHGISLVDPEGLRFLAEGPRARIRIEGLPPGLEELLGGDGGTRGSD